MRRRREGVREKRVEGAWELRWCRKEKKEHGVGKEKRRREGRIKGGREREVGVLGIEDRGREGEKEMRVHRSGDGRESDTGAWE